MNDIRMGDYSTARSVAVAAVQKARANGLVLPLARALYLEAATVAPLGEGGRAIAAAEEAEKIYQRVGDRWGVSNALEYIAYVHATHGEWDDAEKIYLQALAIDRSIGSKTGVAIDLTSIAAAHEARGDLHGGRKMDEEALAIYREIGDRSREGWALAGIGRAVAEDDPVEGLKLDEQALAAFKDVGDDNGTAAVMYEKISELIVLGRLSEAEEACRQSLDLAHKIGVKRSMVSVLFYQGTIAKLEGKLEEASRIFSEALATDHSDAQLSSEIELGLAQVANAEGHLLEAKQHANQCSTYIAQQSSPGDEIGVKAFLATLALESGDTAEAARSLSAARALLSKSQEREAHFIFDIAQARIKAADGKSGEALRSLQALIVETAQHKNVRYQLEGRLALCEIEAGADPVSARAHAKMLEQDAATRGFGWIARKAHAVGG
jgi:tetratricopeptide (TPR) repeat protein